MTLQWQCRIRLFLGVGLIILVLSVLFVSICNLKVKKVADGRYRKSYLRNHAREILAKVKAVLDVMCHKQPRYLGNPMLIPGSQDTAFKDSIRLFSYPQTIEPDN